MSEYLKQAQDFLAKANATIEIKFRGCYLNDSWDSGKEHNCYDVTIKTPRGEMKLQFWDSLHNTELRNMTVQQFVAKTYRIKYDCLGKSEIDRAKKLLEKEKTKAVPNEYDILACLQKYDVGSMDDFFAEFGYEIKSTKDMTNFINTYNAVVKEYNDLLRIFTEEQMEELREIN